EMLFRVALQDQKWDEAAELAKVLSDANHDNAGGALLRFRLALAQGNAGEAEEMAREAVRRLPHFAQSYAALGQALLAQQRFEQAISEFLKALERQNNNLEALRGIIASYYGLQQPENARSYIEQARRVRPGDPSFREAELLHIQQYGNPS